VVGFHSQIKRVRRSDFKRTYTRRRANLIKGITVDMHTASRLVSEPVLSPCRFGIICMSDTPGSARIAIGQQFQRGPKFVMVLLRISHERTNNHIYYHHHHHYQHSEFEINALYTIAWWYTA